MNGTVIRCEISRCPNPARWDRTVPYVVWRGARKKTLGTTTGHFCDEHKPNRGAVAR
jgi:hypothetical protein